MTSLQVVADPSRIRQIITNLIGNAIKFAERGSVTVYASVKPVNNNDTSEGYEFKCEVSDEGIGIAEDKLPLLFKSFTQADASTTRKFGGTGLGLAICKQLCEFMGGDIWVRSALGEGSTFGFKINLGFCDDKQNQWREDALGSTRILLVQNKHFERDVLFKKIEMLQVNQVAVCEPLDFIRYLDRNEDEGAGKHEADKNEENRFEGNRFEGNKVDAGLYDWWVLDLGPDSENCSELCDAIKRNQQGLDKKIIALSRVLDFERVQNLGLDCISSYLMKPVSAKDLLDTVWALIFDNQADYDKIYRSPSFASELTTVKRLERTNYQWPVSTRILLVEDNQINQYVVETLLEEINLSCETAINGVEALATLSATPENAPYSVIFMDCQMPEMDGYETTQRIRAGEAGEHYRSVPIIAMTANAMQGDRQRCIAAGMSDYISKPLELVKVVRVLEKYISVESEQVRSNSSDTKAQSVDDNRPEISELEKLVYETLDLQMFNLQSVSSAILKKPQRFYLLLNSFKDNFCEFPERLVALFEAKDITEVKKLVHSLRGSSGSLGLKLLFDCCSEVEDSIALQGDVTRDRIDQLIQLFTRSMNELDAILQSQNATD